MSHHKITCFCSFSVYLNGSTLSHNTREENENLKKNYRNIHSHTNYPTDSNLNEQKQKQETTREKKKYRQILFEMEME